MCHKPGHVRGTCHLIWRYYKPIFDPLSGVELKRLKRWCYNCAERGHLGDECRRPRPFHVQGGRIAAVVSAFGEENVPQWARLPERKPVRREEEREEAFPERMQDRPPPRKIGGINLARRTGGSLQSRIREHSSPRGRGIDRWRPTDRTNSSDRFHRR
jgi:hypothetical protein